MNYSLNMDLSSDLTPGSSQGGHGTGKTGNLTLTFSRQGKHREFCCDTGKIFFRHRENILTVFCYVNVIFLCTFGSPGFKRWGFVGDSWVLFLIKWLLSGAWKNGASSPSILKAKWTLGLWPVGEGREWHPLATLVHLHCIEEDPPGG